MAEGNRRGIARMACAVGLTAAMSLGGLPLAAVPAWAGTLTVNAAAGNVGVAYDAYQLFTGTVAEKDGRGTISDVKWGAGVEAAFGKVIGTYAGKDGHPAYTGTTAQDAADYLAGELGESTTDTIVDSASLAELLARQLVSDGVDVAAKLSPGEPSDQLQAGYYLVVSRAGSLKGNSAGTAPVLTLVGGSDVAITEKASVPRLGKEVREDSTGTYGRAADANLGQAVSYQLTATLPKNLASYGTYHLKFVDYLSAGLDYCGDAKVTVLHKGDPSPEALDAKSKSQPAVTHSTEGADETVYKDGQSVLTVDIANLRDLKTATGKAIQPTDTIVVNYTAKLNKNSVIGTGGNPNKAKLVYSNDPHTQGTGTTELVDPVLYTYQLNLHKRDKDKPDSGEGAKGLAGARFTLQLVEPDGSSDGDSKNRYVQQDGDLGKDEYEFVTDENGNITVPRIDAGTYELVEKQPPAGYAKLSSNPRIKVTSNRAENGTLELGAEASGNEDTVVVAASDRTNGQVDVTVRDVKNVGMPQTGSAGFAAMIAGGGSLVAVSLAALLRRRR